MAKYEDKKAYRKAMGCYAFKRKVYAEDSNDNWGINVRYYTCPGNLYDPSLGYLYSLFEKYERGFLPFEGTISDQPAKVVECFNLIVNLREDHARKLQEDQQRATNRSQGKSFGRQGNN
jgi:hypothetical protein